MAVHNFKNVTIGYFGGSSASGTYKNEDGYIVIKPTKESTFAVLFDAHTTDSSLVYII